MINIESFKRNTTLGDAAVDGLLAGLGSGCMMGIYLIVGAFSSAGWTTWLAHFDLGGNMLPVTGGLTVLAIAAAYGVIFGIGVWGTPSGWRRKMRSWYMGLGFTLLLLLIAQTLFLPRIDSPVRLIPSLHLILSHVVYGLALGRLINNTGAFTH